MRTNTPRPPAVPVGELLDTIDRTVQGDAREHVLVRHPLQPFDPRNFTPGELGAAPPWSFDRRDSGRARARWSRTASRRGRSWRPRCRRRSSPSSSSTTSWRFVAHPVRAFLRQRLGFGVADYADEVADALPIELDALESWEVGQRMLDARLAGAHGRRGGRGRARPRRAPARRARPTR